MKLSLLFLRSEGGRDYHLVEDFAFYKSLSQSVVQTERDLKKLFPKESWNKLHLQIIFYGREHCPARSCYGLQCDICGTVNPGRKKPIVIKKA